MRILSIETSCDDTGITIMEASGGLHSPTFKILSDQLAVQKIHASFGGVYPMMAKKEHIKSLPILLKRALKEAKIEKVDLIAVTCGPGLEPCLWTGITFAQELAKKWGVPVVPTNHMEGHILSVFAKNSGKFKIPKIKFPVVSLLVSGGHTELVLSKSFLKYELIGKTRDDAAGEAFDKVGRMLGLSYPGGPKISKLAENFRGEQKNISPIALPRPMIHTKDFDFSFAGLKTAVLYLLRKIGKLNKKTKSEIALEFENAVVDTLVYKTKKAMEKYGAKTLIVSGGVSANRHLRKEITKYAKGVKILFPTIELTRDNSLMIGVAGYLQYLKNKKRAPKASNIKADGGLKLG